MITLEEINIPFGTDSIKKYEDWFLQYHDCAKSKDWYNTHNNTGFVVAGTEEYKNIFIRQQNANACKGWEAWKGVWWNEQPQ